MGKSVTKMSDASTTTTADPLDIKDCPVVEELGIDDPNNVFTCKKAEECCTVNLEPACCAQQDMSVAINQQLSLWGPLLGVIFLLALFIWWCRTDEACCDVEKPCLYRFGCKKYPKDDQSEPDPRGSQASLRSAKSSVTVLNPDEVSAENEVKDTEETANDLEEKLEPEAEQEVETEKEPDAEESTNEDIKEDNDKTEA